MEKTIAKRFWQEVWKRYVEKQRYNKNGSVKETCKYQTDSYFVSQAIWMMSDDEFKEILSRVSKNVQDTQSKKNR